jgi:hypothetical protein
LGFFSPLVLAKPLSTWLLCVPSVGRSSFGST